MDYKVIKSKRKTIAIQVSKNGEVIVRIPKKLTDQNFIDKFVNDNRQWIEKQLAKSEKRSQFYDISPQKIEELKRRAKVILPQKVAYFEKVMGVEATGVKITSATTRFGSCNGKNLICFSYRLMMFPEEAIDYVVVHELAHILQKNHSNAFYEIVKAYLPDYKEREKLLKI